MPAAKKQKPKTIQVYNDSDRIISCLLPDPLASAPGERRPPKKIMFMPGNNDEVSVDDWNLCLENKVFARYTMTRPVGDRTGRKVKKKVLVVGKHDENQADEEAELERKIEAARQAQDVAGAS